ncbi:hypothetical protein OE88DRAFT_1417054 [Heliocybe sulcata]|uniref:DUF6534 domain-containing protein n=1 Tax=Heliocybe sulcata TaxID=5364 RepID=A0A5C3N7T2_9AGAM|nr:hypothetical protein OE88DRAFT_1417054 [Heliocybe sulcata]
MGPATEFAGTMLVCIMLTAVLYGVNTTQVFLYYQRYPGDSRSLRTVVAVLWVLDTVHVVFCLEYIYKYAINHFGDDAFMEQIDWTAGVTVIFQLLIAAVVHGYYIRRVWIVTGRNKLMAALVALFGTIRCIFGLISAALSYTYIRWSTYHEEPLPVATSAIALASSALVDCLILICLVYFLKRSQLALDPYEGWVRVFTVYVANSGAFTSVFSVASLVMFIVIPSKFVWLGLVELQSKFYVYAFLTGLNDRARVWDGSTRSARVSTFDFWRPSVPAGATTRGSELDTHHITADLDEEIDLDSYRPSDRSDPSDVRESTTVGHDESQVSSK